MIATFTIPTKPPSVNDMYVTSRSGHRHLSKKATEFKKLVKQYVHSEFAYDQTKYAIEVEIYFYLTKVFTKDNRISKTSGDYDGKIKAIQDAVFFELGIDDSQICKATILKIQANEDKTVFIIKTMPLALVRS